MKRKNLLPRIPYPARLSFRFDGEIQSFPDKQKLREFSTTKNSFVTNTKGTSRGTKHKRRKRPTQNKPKTIKKMVIGPYCCSVVKSCLTLWPHRLQDAKLPYPSPSPRVCSNSCSLSQWYHPTILSFVTLFSVSPSIRVISNMLALHIRWPKYRSFSFSISPSKEYSGLISFRIDWWSCYNFLNCFGFIFCR